MKQLFKNSHRETIRTSPTINTMSYDIYSVYGIPISNFLDRQAIGLALNDDKLKSEVWSEIQAIDKEVAFYKEQKRVLDKKIEKAEQKKEDLKQGIANELRKEIERNMRKASAQLMKHVSEERERIKDLKSRGVRVDNSTITKMLIGEVLTICANNNVTPTMVLGQMDSTVLDKYFDEKCKKYAK